jgi:hypothetical protein
MRKFLLLVLAATALFCVAPANSAPPDTLVLCPAEFRPALSPWLAHRREQGHVVAILQPHPTVPGLKQQIRSAAEGAGLRFVVLVGDAPMVESEAARRFITQPSRRLAPAFYRESPETVVSPTPQIAFAPPPTIPAVVAPAQVNLHWGSEPEIATDSPYADLDDDGLPDVAIGRLPVRSPAELRDLVAKVLDYERTAGHQTWRRRVNIVAGLGGFGRVADAALEVVTRTLLTQGIPAGYQTHLTHASWQSPYCPPPKRFRDCTIEDYNSGCLFWVYLGHGQRTLLDHIHVPGGSFPIFSRSDVHALRPYAGSPIALLVACYSGAFDGTDDCLAEAMVTAPTGPVAVIAASRVTLPYGNTMFCRELMQECFVHRRGTIGEVLLHAKRACTEDEDEQTKALDLLAGLLSPIPADLAAERREHTLLYNLLGDPLLRIAHSEEVRLEVPERIAPGEMLVVRGTAPMGGECTLELVAERGRLTFSPPRRDNYEATEKSAAEYADTYRRANDRRLASTALAVSPGQFTAELTVPRDARGTYCVRAFIEGSTAHAVGAAGVAVRKN